MRSCHTIAVLLSLSTSVFAEDVGVFRPEVGEFPGDKYSHFSWEPSLRGFFISRAFVLPSRQWIVFSVQSNVRNPDRSVVVGIGAYHLPSRAIRHLGFSPGLDEKDCRIVLDDQLGFIPQGGNAFLFPAYIPVDNPPTDQGVKSNSQEGKSNPKENALLGQLRYEQQLWEWDLRTNDARLWGHGEELPIRVAKAIRLGACEIGWKSSSTSDPTQGTLTVRDKHSGKSAKVELQVACRSSDTVSQTYAATVDASVFGVCNPWDLESEGKLEVFCVDPNATRGIRWRLEKRALEQVAGAKIIGAAFLDNSFDPSPSLFLMIIASQKREKLRVFLLRIDSATGRIAKKYGVPLDDDCYEPRDFVLSPSERTVVATLPSLDKADNDVFLRFRVIDLESGQHRDTSKLRGEMAFCRLCGFVNETEVLLSGDHAIYILETKGEMQHRELFRLNTVPF